MAATTPIQKYHVFISYASQELRYALQLRRALEKLGFSVRMDKDIPKGARWRNELEQKLLDATVVITLWSRLAYRSKWVLFESALARQAEKCLPCEIELHKREYPFDDQCYSLVGWNGLLVGDFCQLVQDLETKLQVQTQNIELRKFTWMGIPTTWPNRSSAFRNWILKIVFAILIPVVVLFAAGFFASSLLSRPASYASIEGLSMDVQFTDGGKPEMATWSENDHSVLWVVLPYSQDEISLSLKKDGDTRRFSLRRGSLKRWDDGELAVEEEHK